MLPSLLASAFSVTLTVAAVSAAAAAPTPTDGARGTASPQAPLTAHALITATALEGLMRSELPLAVRGATGPAGPGPLWLRDVRHCGVDGKSRGRIRVVVSPATSTAPPGTLAVSPGRDDCATPLATVARRTLPQGEPTAMVELSAQFRRGQVQLAVEEAAFGGPAEGGAGLRALTPGFTLPPLTTTGLRLNTGKGRRPLLLDVAVDFRPAGVAIAGALRGKGPPGTTTPPTSSPFASRPAEGTAALSLPLELVNTMLDAISRDTPIEVRLAREAIELRALNLSRSGGRLLLTAAATLRSLSQPARLTAHLSGDDLQIADLRIEPTGEDCSGHGALQRIGCNARNATRRAGAEALRAAAMNEYGGRPARTLISGHTLSFDFAGQAIRVTPTVFRLSAPASGLEVNAAIESDR